MILNSIHTTFYNNISKIDWNKVILSDKLAVVTIFNWIAFKS